MEVGEIGGSVGPIEMPSFEPVAPEDPAEAPAPELPAGYDGQDSFEAAPAPAPVDLGGGSDPLAYSFQSEQAGGPEEGDGPWSDTEAPGDPAATAEAEGGTETAATEGETGAEPQPTSYVVQPGDTLSAIAAAHGTTVEAIAAANGISDPNLILAGQNLTIPGAGSAPSQSSPTQSSPASSPVAAPPAQRGPQPSGPAPAVNPYASTFAAAAQAANVPPDWANNPSLLQLVQNESGFNPAARNPNSTAFGLFQFIDSTAASYGVPYGTTDVYSQAVGGFRYIRDIYGSPEAALQFWNATASGNAALARPEHQGKAQLWISNGWAGY